MAIPATTELSGLIRLRIANGNTTRLTASEDTGWRLVRKSKTADRYPGETQQDAASTTPVHDRRRDDRPTRARRVGARGRRHPRPGPAARRKPRRGWRRAAGAHWRPFDFVRLSSEPTIRSWRRCAQGVGFHHAGLPIEVQEALEQAVRDDILPFLTCTSTLTDGVNLPVRTVVIYDQPTRGSLTTPDCAVPGS